MWRSSLGGCHLEEYRVREFPRLTCVKKKKNELQVYYQERASIFFIEKDCMIWVEAC